MLEKVNPLSPEHDSYFDLDEFHNTPYHTLGNLLPSMHHFLSSPLCSHNETHNHKLLFSSRQIEQYSTSFSDIAPILLKQKLTY